MLLRLLRITFSQALGQRLRVVSDRLNLPSLQALALLWLLLLVLALQRVRLKKLNLRQRLL
jgi:hypothetical protein